MRQPGDAPRGPGAREQLLGLLPALLLPTTWRSLSPAASRATRRPRRSSTARNRPTGAVRPTPHLLLTAARRSQACPSHATGARAGSISWDVKPSIWETHEP